MDISSDLWVTTPSPTGSRWRPCVTAPAWGTHSDNNMRAELHKRHVVHNPQALLLSPQIYISLKKKKRVCGSPHTRPAILALGGHS